MVITWLDSMAAVGLGIVAGPAAWQDKEGKKTRRIVWATVIQYQYLLLSIFAAPDCIPAGSNLPAVII